MRQSLLADLLGRVAGCFPGANRQSCSQMVNGTSRGRKVAVLVRALRPVDCRVSDAPECLDG
jgi:hypothetical protein